MKFEPSAPQFSPLSADVRRTALRLIKHELTPNLIKAYSERDVEGLFAMARQLMAVAADEGIIGNLPLHLMVIAGLINGKA